MACIVCDILGVSTEVRKGKGRGGGWEGRGGGEGDPRKNEEKIRKRESAPGKCEFQQT